MEYQIIDLYNDYHLGDNLFTCILFYQIKQYIEDNNIIINYYINGSYINQVNEFNPSKNINILDLKGKKGLHVWIGNRQFNYNWYTRSCSFNEFYVIFFGQLVQILNIPIKINTLEYTDPDLLVRYDKLDDKYKNLDILIINASAFSGQYNCNESVWNDYIQKLNDRYKIVTTKKVVGVNCTLDDFLTIKSIASISTHCKVIICINTGPIVGLLNTYTLNNVKKVFIFDRFTYYSYPNFENKDSIENISFDELDGYINNFKSEDSIE